MTRKDRSGQKEAEGRKSDKTGQVWQPMELKAETELDQPRQAGQDYGGRGRVRRRRAAGRQAGSQPEEDRRTHDAVLGQRSSYADDDDEKTAGNPYGSVDYGLHTPL